MYNPKYLYLDYIEYKHFTFQFRRRLAARLLVSARSLSFRVFGLKIMHFLVQDPDLRLGGGVTAGRARTQGHRSIRTTVHTARPDITGQKLLFELGTEQL